VLALCFYELFFQRQNVFLTASLIADIIHQLFHDMYSQTADSAFLNGTGHVGRFKLDRIEGDSVILDAQAKASIFRCNRDLDSVFATVIKAIGDDIGEQFV
jgi:hypothetical protein